MIPNRALAPKRVLNHLPVVITDAISNYVGQPLVTFSYDDGYPNVYDYALPLHEKYDIPASLNIIAGRINQNPPSRFDVYRTKDAYRRGFEIASHSYYHDINLTLKTKSEIMFEVVHSKTILEKVVGFNNVKSFAIPFSIQNDTVKTIVSQYYDCMRIYGGGLNNKPPVDRFELHSNFYMGNNTTFNFVKSRIDQTIAENKWCVIMLHNVKPDGVLSLYEIYITLLEDVLSYITSLGKDVILPITMKDAISVLYGV